MANYVATVEIEFDDEELKELYSTRERGDVFLLLDGELQNLPFGAAWVKQITRDGKNTITNLSEREEG